MLYTVNKILNIGVNDLNRALNQIHNYYNNKLKFKISPNKSGAMIFCKNFDICSDDLMYNNSRLPWLEEKKFLGVCLDTKLTFKNHINLLLKNSSLGLKVLRSLAGVHWGSDPCILSMLYKSIVSCYSTMAYMNSNLSLLRKLDVIQNKALIIITGAMCSTPINAMECEACIPPLIFRRLLIAEKFCLRLIPSDNTCVLDRFFPRQALQFGSSDNYISSNQILYTRTSTNLYAYSFSVCKYV